MSAGRSVLSSRLLWTRGFTLVIAMIVSGLTLAQSLTPAQRGDLRRFRNQVLEVESQAGRMEYMIAEWQGLGSQVGDSRVQNFNTSAEALATAYTSATETLANLPGDHEEIAGLVERLNAGAQAYQTHIESARSLLEGAQAALEDVGGHEAIQQDMARLGEIADGYSGFSAIMVSEPARALDLIRQFGPAVGEVGVFETKYAEFLQQNNADTAQIRRELTTARNLLAGAQAAGQEQVAQVREIAGRTLDDLERTIATGVSERRPAYFQKDGGVPQLLESAENYVTLARAIDVASAEPLFERWQALNQRAAEAGQSLATEILAANRLPVDRYSGVDAEALKEGVRAAWLEQHAEDVIVRITIPTANWDRETKWTWWRDAFYFTDASDLQAAVAIEAVNPSGEPEIHWFPVNIVKDHENEDVVSYSPWDKEPVDTMDLRYRVLAENL